MVFIFESGDKILKGDNLAVNDSQDYFFPMVCQFDCLFAFLF